MPKSLKISVCPPPPEKERRFCAFCSGKRKRWIWGHPTNFWRLKSLAACSSSIEKFGLVYLSSQQCVDRFIGDKQYITIPSSWMALFCLRTGSNTYSQIKKEIQGIPSQNGNFWKLVDLLTFTCFICSDFNLHRRGLEVVDAESHCTLLTLRGTWSWASWTRKYTNNRGQRWGGGGGDVEGVGMVLKVVWKIHIFGWGLSFFSGADERNSEGVSFLGWLLRLGCWMQHC